MSPPARRDVLRAAAALPAASVPRVPAWAGTTETRVLTRNLGLGAGLLGLLSTDRIDPERVYAAYAAVRDSGVRRRMCAIAGEIAAERPAVVGLQEAALIERGPADAPATETVVDFLGALQACLRERGASYRVAATAANADVELPARPPDGEPFTAGLRDRDVLLVREDVAVGTTGSGAYAVNARTTIDGRTLTATRGYCHADCLVDGVSLTAVSTHLASSSDVVRRLQAAELLDVGGGIEGPLVLCGDFNSGPAGSTRSAYATLAAEFTDAWAVADGAGPTCCQSPTLANDRSRLRRRVDAVFVDGPVEPIAVERTGETRDARVQVGDRRLWPSDHAGVVATLRVAPPLGDPRAVVRSLL